jgi:YHS domain-containing protein
MPQQVIDPVCHMHLDPVLAPFETVWEDRMYYFCSGRCLLIFERDPETYANPEFAGAYGYPAEGEALEQPSRAGRF